ncbi:hypothetical protein D3C81_154060 [compost metagenome]
MRIFVEVRLDKKKQLPAGAASALAIELNTRLSRYRGNRSHGGYGWTFCTQRNSSGQRSY